MEKRGFINIKAGRLRYCLHFSERMRSRSGILFIHAAGGCMLGPSRMFVEFAREFEKMGFAVMRFDLAGCGDSSGVETEIIGDYIEQAIDVIDFFIKSCDIDDIILFGISRGGYIGFSLLSREELPLKGAILLSAPISSGAAAIGQTKSRISEYMEKVNIETLSRLGRGEVNVKAVLKSLASAVKVGKRYPKVKHMAIPKDIRVLMIYGGCDPIYESSARYYSQVFDRNSVKYQTEVIENANHSFFHYKWKEQIREMCVDWVERIKN